MSDKVKRLSEIKPSPLQRCLTGFEDLDYIYGYSTFPDRTEWGMPQGKISLWSGQSGVGKSRLCIEVAKKMSKIYAKDKDKILYFQTEAPLEDFATWAKDTENYSNIYCSGENKIDEIIKIIYEIKPYIVFIDSVNEIEEFVNGNKQEVRRLISGIDGKPGLRKVINDVGGHLILLGQLNQDGKTIKGGTSLPHMVDIALNIRPWGKEGKPSAVFVVEVGVKHRYGKRDSLTVFIHEDYGVIEGTDNRTDDKIWCETHGITYMTLRERAYADAKKNSQTPAYNPDDPGLGLHLRNKKGIRRWFI